MAPERYRILIFKLIIQRGYNRCIPSAVHVEGVLCSVCFIRKISPVIPFAERCIAGGNASTGPVVKYDILPAEGIGP